jgi:hypothetical protein
MSFLKKMFKGKPVPVPVPEPQGKWVENVQHFNYGGGMMGTVPIGTWHWEGPEPANGVRPPNPGTTPEFLAAKEANRLRKIESNAAYAKSQEDRRKARDEKDEEERVCKKACDKAIADLRASRANAIPAARTRKRSTRKQRKTRSRSRR